MAAEKNIPLHQAVLRRANTPPHLPVTQLRLCLASCHIQAGCGMEVFRQRVAHQLFLHLSPRGCGSLVPPGTHGLLGKDDGRIQIFTPRMVFQHPDVMVGAHPSSGRDFGGLQDASDSCCGSKSSLTQRSACG